MDYKEIRVDFYQVFTPESTGASFEDALRTAQRKPAGEQRLFRSTLEHPITFSELKHSGEFWAGDMVRIRMDQLPNRASLKGPMFPIDLRADEGIGEETAFLYHAKTAMICVQFNRSGVRAPAIERYFMEKGASNDIEFRPAMTLEGLQSLAKLQDVRKIEVTIAGTDSGRILEQEDVAIKTAANSCAALKLLWLAIRFQWAINPAV